MIGSSYPVKQLNTWKVKSKSELYKNFGDDEKEVPSFSITRQLMKMLNALGRGLQCLTVSCPKGVSRTNGIVAIVAMSGRNSKDKLVGL